MSIESHPDSTAVASLEPLAAIGKRWSPRAFAPRAVEAEKLRSVFGAARWAASSFNEQPWRFLIANREDEAAFAAALTCLREGNRGWAKLAPVLIFSVAKRTYSNSGGENRHAWYDVGQAVAILSIQATALGLHLHQMGGFYPERVREEYALPDDFEAVTAIALGYLGDPQQLPEDLQAKERRARVRKPLSELIFAGTFGRAAEFTGE